MSSPSIVAVISGRSDSHDAVRWAAWLSRLEDAVDAYLAEGGVLVTDSHVPAELLSWGCRVEGCPVVVVPGAATPAVQGLDERARRVAPVAVGVPA